MQWGKEWIDGAVQASPQASIAWAAICIALPLLTKPAAAEQANKDGFDYVTTRMRYYIALESLMLPQSEVSATYASSKNLKDEFEMYIVDLYQHILNFQIRSVLRFYRSTLGNFGRDLMQKEDWKQMQENIQNLEKIVNGESQHMGALESRKALCNLAKNAETSCQRLQNILTIAQEHLQVGKEQLSTQKQMAQTIETINRRMRSQDEKKCLQLFRLQRNEEDQFYKWYKSRVDERVERTCQWFLAHDHYKKWLQKDSGPLLVSVDPGCGKSMLAKYLIDSKLPQSSLICYFFFKD